MVRYPVAPPFPFPKARVGGQQASVRAVIGGTHAARWDCPVNAPMRRKALPAFCKLRTPLHATQPV